MKTPREILLRRHESLEPQLNQLWDKSLAPSVAAVYDRQNPFLAFTEKLWSELILPNRRIWAGLAGAWIVIAVLNLTSAFPEPTTQAAGQLKPQSREEVRALVEQRRMFAQLIGPLAEPSYVRKQTSPGPRS